MKNDWCEQELSKALDCRRSLEVKLVGNVVGNFARKAWLLTVKVEVAVSVNVNLGDHALDLLQSKAEAQHFHQLQNLNVHRKAEMGQEVVEPTLNQLRLSLMGLGDLRFSNILWNVHRRYKTTTNERGLIEDAHVTSRAKPD